MCHLSNRLCLQETVTDIWHMGEQLGWSGVLTYGILRESYFYLCFYFSVQWHTVRCCRALAWVSSLIFLGSQQRELTSGGHFRALKFIIVVYLWSLDSWEKAHKSGHFQALQKCLIIKISIVYIDLKSKCRAWSEFAFILFLSRLTSDQEH